MLRFASGVFLHLKTAGLLCIQVLQYKVDCEGRRVHADHTEMIQILAKWVEDRSAAEQSAPKYATKDFQIRWDTCMLNLELAYLRYSFVALSNTITCIQACQRHFHSAPLSGLWRLCT